MQAGKSSNLQVFNSFRAEKMKEVIADVFLL